MPVWYPPTPPQGDGDIYIDVSLSYLYDWNIMLESQLPPVYIKRDNKRSRSDVCHSPDRHRPSKSHRRDESVYAPRSLFEKTPYLIKMRRDLKLQKHRNPIRSAMPMHGILKPAPRPQSEPSSMLGWTLLEDKRLLDSIKSQGLPLNLTIVSPGHTPNWDLVADMVNNASRIYRSPKQCRYRYETEILPREEGKSLLDANQKKQKKSKSHKSSRSMRTAHLYEQDNNSSFTKDIICKFEIMKSVLNKRTTTPKRRYDDPNMKNPKHVAVLSEYGVNYESPCNPMEVATKRVERIAKEKQKSSSTPTPIVTEQVVTPARLVQSTVKVPPSPPLGVTTTTVVQSTPRPPLIAQRVLQADPTRSQRIVVGQQQALIKGTAGGKTPLSPAQIQYLRQQALARQHMKVFQHQTVGGVQQIGVVQQGVANKLTPVTLTSIQVSSAQQRPQIAQAGTAVNKQAVGRTTVTEVDINALFKRQQAAVQQKQPVTQIFTSQQQIQSLQGTSGERVTIAGTSGVAVAGTVNVGGTPTKVATGTGILANVATALPGKPMKMATSQQFRQLQLQQQLTLAQRKGQKVTQLTQVGGGAQVIVQTPGTHKTLPTGVTMHQIHQVMRQNIQAGARVLPRQTIQVVGSNQVQAGNVTTVPASQVILSQVSAALKARQPTATANVVPTSTANVRPATIIPAQPSSDPQPKT